MNFDKLMSVFQEALEEHPPDEWDDFVRTAAGGDEELFRQVCQLLHAHAHGDSLLDKPAVPNPTLDQPITERPGAQIGPYKLLQEIGQGGMGVIYMAEQTEPVKRRLALKIIKPGMDTRQVIARFEAERQALSLMDHPNIAKVLDAGATESGRPYFVMELVKGQPITQYCDEHHLTPRQRLEILLPVCQAIQHAHQKGIIHRDIKPTNILVAEYDQQPVPKVIDFGVAKATSQTLTEKTMFTGYGQIVGTLEYMSPEQAKVNQLDIDTRSDVYSLGVLLYELLTGSTPFDRQRLRTAAFDEMLRIIREEEPQKPSTKLSSSETLPSVAANRSMEPARLSKTVRGELDWIVMKALDKDRNRRYETASGLAQDLQRYLADEPVQACPPSAGYRFRKFARRNKRALVLVTGLAVMLLFAALSFAVSTYLVWREKDRTQEANLRLKNNLELALETLDEIYVKVAEQHLPRDPVRKQEQLELLKKSLSFYERFAQQNSTDPEVHKARAKAYQRAGAIRQLLDQFDDAENALGQAIGLYQALRAKNPADRAVRFGLATAHLNLALAQFRSGRHTGAIGNLDLGQSLLQELVAEEPSEQAYRRDLAQAFNNRATLLMLERRLPEAQAAYERAAGLWSQLVSENSDELEFRAGEGEVLTNLGNLLTNSGRLAEAEETFERAVPIFNNLVEQDPNGTKWRRGHAVVYSNLAQALRRMGRTLDAEKAMSEAIRLQRQLVDDFGTVPEFQADLALSNLNRTDVLGELGRFTEAEESHRESLKYLEQLAQDFPEVPGYRRDQALNYFGLSRVLRIANKQAEAVQVVQRAIAIQEELTANHPTVPEYQRDLAISWHAIASLLVESNRQADAEVAFRKAKALQQALIKGWPDVGEYRQLSVETSTNLVNLLGMAGNLREADQASHEAIEQFRTFVGKLPTDDASRRGLARSLLDRARVLRAMGRADEAGEAEQEAIAIWEQLAIDFAGVAQYRIDLAEFLHEQARLLRVEKRLDEAEKPSVRALELWEQLVAEYPVVAQYRIHLGGHLNNRGQLFWSRGDLRRACEYFERAIEHQEEARKLVPGSAQAQMFLRNHYSNLADVLTHLGRHAEAARAAEHLSQVMPDEQHCYTAAVRLLSCVRLAEKDAGLSTSDRNAAVQLYTVRIRGLLEQAELHHAETPADAMPSPQDLSRSNLCRAACVYAFLASNDGDDPTRNEHHGTRAVELLRLAVQPENRAELLEQFTTDTDLDPLRARDDFQKLLADLATKQE